MVKFYFNKDTLVAKIIEKNIIVTDVRAIVMTILFDIMGRSYEDYYKDGINKIIDEMIQEIILIGRKYGDIQKHVFSMTITCKELNQQLLIDELESYAVMKILTKGCLL